MIFHGDFYREFTVNFEAKVVGLPSGNLPVVPHKAVAEVSKIGNL